MWGPGPGVASRPHRAGSGNQRCILLRPAQKGSLFFGEQLALSSREEAARQRRQTPATRLAAQSKQVTCSTQIHLSERLSGRQAAGASLARARRSPLVTRVMETSWEQLNQHVRASRALCKCLEFFPFSSTYVAHMQLLFAFLNKIADPQRFAA